MFINPITIGSKKKVRPTRKPGNVTGTDDGGDAPEQADSLPVDPARDEQERQEATSEAEAAIKAGQGKPPPRGSLLNIRV